jgi:hypothetical protein
MTLTFEQRTEKNRRDAIRSTQKAVKELERAAKKIPVPEDFVAVWEDDASWYSGANIPSKKFVLRSKKHEVDLVFRPGGSGTTKFKVNNNWLTFDRRGVEDSFYWKEFSGKELRDFNAMILDQSRRVREAREFHQTALKVPDVGFSVSPDRLKALQKEIKTLGYVTFHPSGFGTGYRVVKKSHNRFGGSRRASADLEKFLECAPLWIETFDCD